MNNYEDRYKKLKQLSKEHNEIALAAKAKSEIYKEELKKLGFSSLKEAVECLSALEKKAKECEDRLEKVLSALEERINNK